ncbi:MAG: ABC transporter permease, partial [Planctomycetes bacterium]|nr:ABC transporter permease [Planctomycetota bacterium]
MTNEAPTTERSATVAGDAPNIGGEATGVDISLGSRLAVVLRPVERWLERLGDWLNPILVKETRQALKSFQFTITFVLVLVACWVVTIGGVALIGPGIYYGATGGTLLLAYYTVLAFPLTVVVPYSAFRSLAAEREDNTYELLSITTLKPRQIISGKLGSSVVQMAVYFSAIAPCLAFTYLLRGVDVPTIAVLLIYTFFGSLGLSMLGILLATLTDKRLGQVFLSVAFVAGLLWVFGMSFPMAAGAIGWGYSYLGNNGFWVAILAFATMYATTFALAYFAAAGMISFASENRSTPLRITMLLQQAAFIGWMSWAWIVSEYALEGVLVFAMLAAIYWYVMGALLTTERPKMSERVKRRLPQSFLGRVFLTWLNPGPGTGYLFVVANATTIVVIGVLAIAVVPSLGLRINSSWWPSLEELVYLLLIGWGYLVAYLGLGWLVIRGLRRITAVT